MTSVDTSYLGEVHDGTEDSMLAGPPFARSSRSSSPCDDSYQEDGSVHYSEASSSVMTPFPVAHQISENYLDDGTETPVSEGQQFSMEGYSLEATPNSGDLPPTLSPSTGTTEASVPQPSYHEDSSRAFPSDEPSIASSIMSESTFNSNYTSSTDQVSYAESKPVAKAADFSSSYSTSSKKSGTKLSLNFLPVRESSSGASTCGSMYSRSSKRSVRRRDVIKPVALAAEPKETVKDASQLVPSPKAPKSQWAMPNPQAGCADLVAVPSNAYNTYSLPNASDNLALVLRNSSKEPRGIDPSETTRGNGCDPPGEEPTARPSSSPSSPYAKKYRNVQWVDPKSITDESEIDYDMLNKYRQLSSGYSPYYAEPAPEEKRIRIATISSGYKTANFFVREDLDQRIYFHELEDAVSYMARRGYARMEKGEEKEWMKLLGRAHQVVKVGPTKKKQRYRKGKLVLIMYKPIVTGVDHYSDVKKKDPISSQDSTASTATTHTSLGRSIRCGYKSYSEKFLAEQEYEKKQGLMLLTNGGPCDAPEYHHSNPDGLLQITNGVGTMSCVDEEKSRSSGSKSSSNSNARRGVYGGGIRYFTPDKNYEEEESDSESSQETEEFEDSCASESENEDAVEVEGSDMGSMLSEEDVENSYYRNDGVESISSSVASSTVNSEMSSIQRNSGGVNMASGSKYGNKNTLNKKRAPTPFDKSPEMVPISDESESGSWE